MEFLIASITPVIIFMFLVYHKDHVKEPPKLLLSCFLGGFVVYLLALMYEEAEFIWIDQIGNNFLHDLCHAFLNAALPEEMAKFCLLYIIVWNNKSYDHYYSGILYAVFISLGMALIENITYVFHHGLVTAFFRAVLAVPGHGFFAVIMGYYFSKAKLGAANQKMVYLSKSLLYPILFHGAYDFSLMYMDNIDDRLVIFLVVLLAVTLISLWKLGIKDIKVYENT